MIAAAVLVLGLALVAAAGISVASSLRERRRGMGLNSAVVHLAQEVGRLASALSDEPSTISIGLAVARVHGRKRMSNIDRGSIDLVDTEKSLLSITGKDLGGVPRAVPPAEFIWESSNPAAVVIEEVVNEDGTPGDAYTRWARTPAPGQAVVTVTHAPTGNTETLSIAVKNSGPGEIGLSAGAPVLE